MAVVSRIARINLSGGTGSREWTATAVIQDTPAGSSVDITIAQTTSGATPPDAADIVELRIANDAGTQVINFGNVGLTTQTFHFTNDGTIAGSSRTGTLEIILRVQKNTGLAATQYNIESDGAPLTTPTLFTTTSLDRGWIRGTTTLTEHISNTSLGGTPNEPAAYDDSLFVRLTSGADAYVARALAVTLSNGSLSGNTNSTTSAVRDLTFTNVVDNRFPLTSASVSLAAVVPNATLTGQPAWVYSSTIDDSIIFDPRLTITPQAQKVTPFAEGGNNAGPYTISADQLFVWVHCQDARGENQPGVTLTQQIKNGSTVIIQNTAETTGASGWTPVAGIDFTTALTAPAGNRTQLAFPNAPADAIGLGTQSQILGIASAYTANRILAIHLEDQVEIGADQTIIAEYIDTNGDRLALDDVPTARIYSINPTTGVLTEQLSPTVMTQIGATNSYKKVWTPSANGIFIAEVAAQFAGGGIVGQQKISVRPAASFDATALALSDVMSFK